MKKALVLAISFTALSATLAPGTQAGVPTHTKQEVTAIGAIATGAALGGPLGAFAGLITGAWLAEEVGRAGEHDQLTAALARETDSLEAATARVASLQQSLTRARADQDRLARSMLESLEVALMFRTGDSVLSDTGVSRLASLARYLQRNPDLRVSISGFADPRGSDAANLALSQARATAVATALVEAGVAGDRLSVSALGEQQSVAAADDPDAMALERRVVIELRRPRGLAGRTLP